MKKQYAVDKLVGSAWEPASLTDMTLRQAEKQADKMAECGKTARIMSWTQKNGYQVVKIVTPQEQAA